MPGLLEALREYDVGSRLMMAGSHLQGQPGAANAIMLAMMERKERKALDAKRASTIQKLVAKRPELAPLFEANPELVDTYFSDEYKAKQALDVDLARERRKQAADLEAEERKNRFLLEKEARDAEANLAKEARENQYRLEQEQRAQEYGLAGEGRKTQAEIEQEQRAQAYKIAEEKRAREADALKTAADPTNVFRNQFLQDAQIQQQELQAPGAGMQGSKPLDTLAMQNLSGVRDMAPAEAAQYKAGSMAGPEHQATALRAIHDDRRQAENANMTNDYRNYQLAGGDAKYTQGGFAQYQQEQKSGVTVYDPQTGNKLYETGGGKSGSKTSEDQRKGLDLLIRAKEKSVIIDELEKDLISYTALGSSIGAEVPLIGNYLQSDKYRAGMNAGVIWVNSVKRRDSGAALQIYESEQYNRMFIPQPGDDPETLAGKRAARKAAERGMEAGLTEEQILYLQSGEAPATAENPEGKVTKPPTLDTPGTDDGVYTFNPETGKLE